ncbi:MAG: CpXC domain-containing protein, partial [Chloroflexota bacterium]|nr:CpXC domain-containing protein [Chloroflexota bacterium]
PSSEKPSSEKPDEQVIQPEPGEVVEQPAQDPGAPQIELAFPPQIIGVNCPSCGTPYPVQVFSIVDVKQDPILKSVLLSGQLNVATCPNCGASGAVAAPLLYHDPEKEFLGVHVPEQIPVNEQQKVIGDLSRGLMDSLPQEDVRGYMLTPMQFLSYQALIEAVLENEGVTREMMDRQRRQIRLLEEVIVASSDPEGLRLLVNERDEEMDDQFFGLLHTLIESSASSGDQESIAELTELRERLIELSTWGKGVQEQRAAVAQLKPDTTVAELLDMIVAADADGDRVVDALVTAGRPLVDYSFFEMLTSRIGSASDPEEVTRLENLREHILDFVQQLDELQQALLGQYRQVLAEILASDDIPAAVAEHAALIDQNFLSVLATNLEEAENSGATAAVSRLQEVWDATMALVQEAAPPELQLVNELMAADSSQETRAILAANRDAITPGFMETLDGLIEQASVNGNEEVVARLRQIRSQAALMS